MKKERMVISQAEPLKCKRQHVPRKARGDKREDLILTRH